MTDNRTVALPDGWLGRIRHLAAVSRRSVHAELLWLLELGLHAEESLEGNNDNDSQDRR